MALYWVKGFVTVALKVRDFYEFYQPSTWLSFLAFFLGWWIFSWFLGKKERKVVNESGTSQFGFIYTAISTVHILPLEYSDPILIFFFFFYFTHFIFSAHNCTSSSSTIFVIEITCMGTTWLCVSGLLVDCYENCIANGLWAIFNCCLPIILLYHYLTLYIATNFWDWTINRCYYLFEF